MGDIKQKRYNLTWMSEPAGSEFEIDAFFARIKDEKEKVAVPLLAFTLTAHPRSTGQRWSRSLLSHLPILPLPLAPALLALVRPCSLIPRSSPSGGTAASSPLILLSVGAALSTFRSRE